MRPSPFTRIGSRVVLGLLDTRYLHLPSHHPEPAPSHSSQSGRSSTLGRGSTLVGRVTPYQSGRSSTLGRSNTLVGRVTPYHSRTGTALRTGATREAHFYQTSTYF